MKSLLIAVALLSPHSFGLCDTTAPSAATQYEATISIPSAQPAAGAQYAWIMAEDSQTMFTQIGWVWFAPGTGLTLGGQPVPSGSPYLFSYTTIDQGNGDALGAGGTYLIGPALSPGSTLTVDIAHSGNWYGDEYLSGGVWTMAQSVELVGSPLWLTASEAWGASMSICFTDREYYANAWLPLPDECH